MGTSWSLNTCQTCLCTEEKNETSGFYIEKCVANQCPPIDEEACTQNGGVITSTDDGCCIKCQAAECYECRKKTSSSPEYLVVEDECTSTIPVTSSHCDGFCRGSYFWSTVGTYNQCSCCLPAKTVQKSVILSCKNGSEVEYQYQDVLSCQCKTNCTSKIKSSFEKSVDVTLPTTKSELTVTPSFEAAYGSAKINSTSSASFSCYWSEWMNSDRPKGAHLDDNETYAHIRESGITMCRRPVDIECRESLSKTIQRNVNSWAQIISCDVNKGFLCLSRQQIFHPVCRDYEIRVYCCESPLNHKNEK